MFLLLVIIIITVKMQLGFQESETEVISWEILV